MFGHKRAKAAARRQSQANAALQQSEADYALIQALKPQVEATVREHRRLQYDNHFAERIWLAYSGEEGR